MNRYARVLTAVFCLVTFTTILNGCAPLAVGAAAGTAGGSVEAAKASERGHHSAGTYVATVLSNIVYFPAKVIFATGGAVASGVTYIVTIGDSSTTRAVWDASVGGDYLVSPRMIEGREAVRFVG